MDDQQTVDRWFRGDSVPGVDFGLNASVEIVKGPHSGKRGAVVSLLEVKPDVVFVVELSEGNDVQVYQSQLRALDQPC